MPANPRPTEGDATTIDNLLIGMPFVEFAPLVGGVQQPFINLGVVANAELAKALEVLALETSQSGTRVTLRELISKIDPQWEVGIYNFAAEILRYSLGSSTITPVSADPVAAVTDELVQTTQDPEDFLDLNNQGLNTASVVVTAAAVADEQIGTSDGSLGSVSGDFTLDYKVNLVADVTRIDSITTAGVVTSWTPIATGAAVAGNEVEVEVGTGAISGDLQFFVGGVAQNLANGEIVEGDYAPSHVLTEGVIAPDDYTMDLKNGRIRVITEATKATGTQVIIFGQTVAVDYTYNRLAHNEIQPFTQTTFAGVARVRQLADVGINFIWEIPSSQIQLTDDPFAFADDDFTVGTVTLKVLDAGGTQRFGTMQVFSETEANA